ELAHGRGGEDARREEKADEPEEAARRAARDRGREPDARERAADRRDEEDDDEPRRAPDALDEAAELDQGPAVEKDVRQREHEVEVGHGRAVAERKVDERRRDEPPRLARDDDAPVLERAAAQARDARPLLDADDVLERE